MTPPAAPPPTKKRKLNRQAGNSSCDNKELRRSFFRHGDDRKKVLEAVKSGLQDVTVAFYSASEVTLLDKKDIKIENVWNDLKQGTRGMLQTCHSYIQKGKEDMAKEPLSLHDNSRHKPKHSGYRCSSLLKTKNLRDLLPSSQFHSVRKRTPFSIKTDHIRSGANLYSPNGQDSESKLGAAADSNSSTYLSVPISVEATQIGRVPLVSQILKRTVTGNDLFPARRVERKHSDKRTHNLDFKGSILDRGSLQVRGKFTKAYVRKKYRKPFFKDKSPDLYALHLLADTALNLGSERNGGQASTSEAAAFLQKDFQPDKSSLDGHISPEVNHLICTSINEKQNFNQDLKKKISRDNITIDTHMDEFHLTKILQDTFLPEHREIIYEDIVKKDDIDLKRDSKCFRERYSMSVSMDSVFHDKESLNIYCENSQPTFLTCMQTPQKFEGCLNSLSTKKIFNLSLESSQNSKECPNFFNANNLLNQSPDYRVSEIVQFSKQKAARMVDVAIKVMSSMKVGEDAYAMIGVALDSVGIQQVEVHSRISRIHHYSYPQNWGPGNCHQDLSCNPAEVAAIFHPNNATVPTFSQNDSQIPPKLISACVAALLMIQACSDRRLPPAEAMEILEYGARDLQPQYSENLNIYREIEELMGIIKSQILSLVRTPTSNLHV